MFLHRVSKCMLALLLNMWMNTILAVNQHKTASSHFLGKFELPVSQLEPPKETRILRKIDPTFVQALKENMKRDPLGTAWSTSSSCFHKSGEEGSISRSPQRCIHIWGCRRFAWVYSQKGVTWREPESILQDNRGRCVLWRDRWTGTPSSLETQCEWPLRPQDDLQRSRKYILHLTLSGKFHVGASLITTSCLHSYCFPVYFKSITQIMFLTYILAEKLHIVAKSSIELCVCIVTILRWKQVGRGWLQWMQYLAVISSKPQLSGGTHARLS